MNYGIGFDIGGTHIRAALIELENLAVDSSREVVKFSIRDARTEGEIAQKIVDAVINILEMHDLDISDIAHIAIAIAGQIAPDLRTIINAPNLGWIDVQFAALVEEKLTEIGSNHYIRLVNDLNAIAWGEHRAGATQGHYDILTVYVGTGIGAGLICNGNLVRGASNVGGEIGHFKLANSTRACGCGQRGCVEAMYGGKAIEERLLEDLGTQKITRQDLQIEEGVRPSARLIEQAYERGLPYALEMWQDTSRVLGKIIADATCLLNPSAVLLGGGVFDNCPRLHSLVLEHIREQLSASALENLEFFTPKLGDSSGVIGAACL